MANKVNFPKFYTMNEDGESLDPAKTLDESIDDAKDVCASDVDGIDEGESVSVGVYKLVKVVTMRNRGPETIVTSVA